MKRYLLAAAMLASCAPQSNAPDKAQCDISLIVLGVAQDAGKPQIGHSDDPAWTDESLKRFATSLALVDRRSAAPKRWLFEATPDIKTQLYRLDRAAPAGGGGLSLEGVFLTHAHIGHYTGLMMVGKEAAGAQNLPVFAMPRMANFLSENGPWRQLVRNQNILLAIMSAGEAETIAPGVSVTPFIVPHRDEYSETAGFRIEGPARAAIFIPDIDRWEDFDKAGTRIETLIAGADIAYLDATFYAGDELPGRDMSKVPHPLVAQSMQRFAPLSGEDKAKVRFIHMNHTNPLLEPGSKARAAVTAADFNIADEGEEMCL